MSARVTFFVVFFVFPALATADERILHDRLPPISSAEVSALLGRASEVQATFSSDEASMRGEPASAEAMPPAGRRTMSYSPDRQTRFEGNAGYHEVFSPSIAPYKRVSALDAVTLASDNRTPLLVTASSARVLVPVMRADEAALDARARDSFWGRVTLEFDGDTRIPLPSVSPESRVLGLRSTPSRELRIEKDAADNFFVVAPRVLHESVAVEFLMDAPRDYFGGEIPDADRSALAALAAPLPPSVRGRAQIFAAEIGIGSRMRYRATLDRLVEYFRSFIESDEPPTNTGDAYLDLARGKRGVCRHRAYAFMITALGLGIPTRFVSNEAHAWVEVMLPTRVWRRIDLGGAAQALRAHQREQTTPYESPARDPLPRPAEYEAAYAEASAAQRREAQARGESSRAPAASSATSTPLPATWRRTDEPPPPNAFDSASRSRVVLTLDESERTTFRGRELFVSGRAVDDAGVPATELRIEVSLLSAEGDRYLPLGVTATEEDGRFRLSVGVPRDVPPGDYRLYVATPGDRRYGPSRVE